MMPQMKEDEDYERAKIDKDAHMELTNEQGGH
jgi:hypothetical protein